MAHDPFPAESRREREARRRDHRNRNLRIAGALVAAAAIGTTGVLVGTDVIRLGEDGPRLARAEAEPSGNPFLEQARDLPDVSTLEGIDPPREISHDDPLRLWVGGDSLAGAFGPGLGALAGATGAVATQIDYRVSSGLASDGVRDWDERAAEQMAAYDPEAVVFIVGANDTSVVSSRTEDWEPEYRLDVARMMDLLTGGDAHRTVFWLGPPTLSDDRKDAGAVELGRVMREEADRREDVTYVDTYALFAGEDGGYTATLPAPDGTEVRVRNGDGVHFTEAGAQRLAAAVFVLLDARWEIQDHADPAQPIGFDFSPGSGGDVYLGTGGSGSGSSGSSSGGSAGSGSASGSTTTATAAASTTAPATTAAPTTTAAAASTTAPPTTAAPTTTSPPRTTAPPTTAAPPTSAAPTTAAPPASAPG